MQSRKTALTLRGKSAKYFKIKLGDTIFNGSMCDYVVVILRLEGIVIAFFYASLKLHNVFSVIRIYSWLIKFSVPFFYLRAFLQNLNRYNREKGTAL
jgi:hypothetical protein